MGRILTAPPADLETVDVVIIGAGACGLVAAIAAREAGAEVVVFERDATPAGSTALSAGLIPAPGTRAQKRLGIEDSAALFAADIMAKAHGTAAPEEVALIAESIGPTLDWLSERHGVAFDVVDNFRYPGHSRHRMHGTTRRSGVELLDHLRAAAEAAGVDILTSATVTALHSPDHRRITGVTFTRPGGEGEQIGCRAVVLACNGFGGAKDLVARHIPEMADALYFGHPGNAGDALLWGEALGAKTADLGAYQGHGSVASPHGLLITWAVIMEGGFQVNQAGLRFSNEAEGYSEQAMRVIAQPGGIAYDIFDQRIAQIAAQFEDFRQAEALGAVIRADTPEALAAALSLPPEAFGATLRAVEAAKAGRAVDAFGRPFAGGMPLAAPYCAVRVTGALFHTQGGLEIDSSARVMTAAGPLPNLFAGGGAARGVSGRDVSGYLSGNGLVAAVALGAIAGRAAGDLVKG